MDVVEMLSMIGADIEASDEMYRGIKLENVYETCLLGEIYLHDDPQLEKSKIAWKIYKDFDLFGVKFTCDAGKTWNEITSGISCVHVSKKDCGLYVFMKFKNRSSMKMKVTEMKIENGKWFYKLKEV